jgi:peptidoglycan LD-endopeptidase LytH
VTRPTDVRPSSWWPWLVWLVRPPRGWVVAGSLLTVSGVLAVVALWASGSTRPAAAVALPSSTSPQPTATAAYRYAFPVSGKAAYAHTHLDYPASDIIAACGSPVRAAADGVVLELSRVDRYNPAVDDGTTRGGLFVSILGDDGVRYYGAHLSSVAAALAPGDRVQAGQVVGAVGQTGHAGACHLHFGISPPCARGGDWWIRRGVIWPWPYLDSWRRGGARSPVAEITQWVKAHGCPTAP